MILRRVPMPPPKYPMKRVAMPQRRHRIRPVSPKAASVKRFEKRWKAQFELRCWCCHVPHGARFLGDVELHHIRRGANRVCDPAHFILLCERCHNVVHGDRIPWNGGSRFLPPITVGQLCAIKEEHDPDGFSPMLLVTLDCELESLPAFYLNERTLYV